MKNNYLINYRYYTSFFYILYILHLSSTPTLIYKLTCNRLLQNGTEKEHRTQGNSKKSPCGKLSNPPFIPPILWGGLTVGQRPLQRPSKRGPLQRYFHQRPPNAVALRNTMYFIFAVSRASSYNIFISTT